MVMAFNSSPCTAECSASDDGDDDHGYVVTESDSLSTTNYLLIIYTMKIYLMNVINNDLPFYKLD